MNCMQQQVKGLPQNFSAHNKYLSSVLFNAKEQKHQWNEIGKSQKTANPGNDSSFNLEGNCVQHRWESETLTSIINHKVNKVN